MRLSIPPIALCAGGLIIVASGCASVQDVPRDAVGVEWADPASMAPLGDLQLYGCPFPNTAITADVAVRGTAKGDRVRGDFRARTDLLSGSLHLESIDAALPAFTFVARDAWKTSDDVIAALFLRGNQTVRSERSIDVIQALLGVPLTAGDLAWVISGCLARGRFEGSISARRFGEHLVQFSLERERPIEMWMRRTNERFGWTPFSLLTTVAGDIIRWRATFDDRVHGVPARVHVVSDDWHGIVGRTFDLQFSLTHVRLDPMFDPSAFADPPQGPGSIVAVNDLWRTRPPQRLPLLIEDRTKQ